MKKNKANSNGQARKEDVPRAQRLIQRLDEIAGKDDIVACALITPLGPIFPWQENKLRNLKTVLHASVAWRKVYNDPYGFVIITAEGEDATNHNIHIRLELLPGRMLGEPGEDDPHDALAQAVKDVWESHTDWWNTDPDHVYKQFLDV